MIDMTSLMDKYYSWLRDKAAWKSVNNWIEITAPYLDRNNDYIQIYLKKNDDGFLLTDDGATIWGLKEEGCLLDTPKRQKILQMTIKGFGVSIEDDRLSVIATQENFALRKHSLLQAILAINDMFYLAESHIKSLFFEDVRNWMDESSIRYSQNVSFYGKSGYTRNFDFLISKSKDAPERIVKTINNPTTRNSADSIIIDWLDTKETRPEESKAYAFVNDNDRKVSGNVMEALNSYDIVPILWTKRQEHMIELAS